MGNLTTPTDHHLDGLLNSVEVSFGFGNDQHRARLIQLDTQGSPRAHTGIEMELCQLRPGVVLSKNEESAGSWQMALDGDGNDCSVLGE